jgi:hypothetical protein
MDQDFHFLKIFSIIELAAIIVKQAKNNVKRPKINHFFQKYLYNATLLSC